MKKYILLFLALFLYTSTIAQPTTAQPDNKVTIGTIDTIESKILNEKRKIWVYVPNNGAASVFAKQRYPVVYLLDGDGHFNSVVGMIQQLSQVNGNTIVPEMIVVGIPNTDRTRDLTPTHVDSDPPFMSAAASKTSGGGEKFIGFIEKELMPYIESTYPTQPYKMLIGHSFGGLIVMNTLINHTKLFNSYICIDPSMWWDKGNFLTTTKKALSERNLTGRTLYLGIANTMEKGMDVKKVISETSSNTRHIRSILELNKHLLCQKQNGLRYAGKYYDDDDHGSLPLIAEYDALRFIFGKYRLKLSPDDFADISGNLKKKIETHFVQVSTQMGYKINPPESLVNALGYNFLQQKKYDKAGSFFKMNVDNYPNSFNVYDSYGDYFVAIKDKPKAIANFKKSLSIKEISATRKKLEKLLPVK